MLRRNVRLRIEYIYRKSLEGKERLLYEKKRKIKGALEEGKPIPTELRNEEAELRREINLEDENTAIPKTNIDDEYASASEKYPKILVTTSRNPSAPLTQFVKELKFVFPNAQRMNRGGQVTRHDIKDKKAIGTMPEAYPHLILNNFSTKLGQRTAHILKHLFPVPKPDTKRIITFANQSDYSSFRPNPSMHLSRRFYSSIDRKIGYHDQATMRLHMGIDFHHWLIVMKEHEDNPIDGFIETLAVVVGSKEEAQQKIYSVSTGHYNAFGARISEKIALQILALPRVRWVMPDFYVDCENKLYGGRPYVNGQVQYGVRNF